MFCEYCGNKLNEDARFCSKCGKSVTAGQNVTAGGGDTGKCKLTIERLKCIFTYSLTKYNVYIDGQQVKKLAKNECFTIELSNGRHNIHFDAFGFKKTPSFEFFGNNNEIKYTVSSPSVIDTLGSGTGFLVDAPSELTINKVFESEPGTYR